MNKMMLDPFDFPMYNDQHIQIEAQIPPYAREIPPSTWLIIK
jgi:hypothetical protein